MTERVRATVALFNEYVKTAVAKIIEKLEPLRYWLGLWVGNVFNVIFAFRARKTEIAR